MYLLVHMHNDHFHYLGDQKNIICNLYDEFTDTVYILSTEILDCALRNDNRNHFEIYKSHKAGVTEILKAILTCTPLPDTVQLDVLYALKDSIPEKLYDYLENEIAPSEEEPEDGTS